MNTIDEDNQNEADFSDANDEEVRLLVEKVITKLPDIKTEEGLFTYYLAKISDILRVADIGEAEFTRCIAYIKSSIGPERIAAIEDTMNKAKHFEIPPYGQLGPDNKE